MMLFGPGGSFAPGQAAARLANLASRGQETDVSQIQDPGGAPLPSTLQAFYEANPDLPSSDQEMVLLALAPMGYHPGDGVIEQVAMTLKAWAPHSTSPKCHQKSS